MEVAWTSRKHCIGQRRVVCSGNNKKTELLIGNSNKTLDGLLPSNRWADGKNKPEAETVSESLYRP